MRNLKRALSLALASVMLLGMMVVGSSAAGYRDVDSQDNQEAIEVLQAVGIMTGDENGNFNPDKTLTRNEMAVVMCNLMDYVVSSYHGAATFSDVPAWAEDYVSACATNGIVSGIGDGKYGGDMAVTTGQAALMLMKALGYFQFGSDFGDDWLVATTKQGALIHLFDGVDTAATAPLTRNQVAQLVLNTLEADMVQSTGNGGSSITVGDTNINLGAATYESRTSNNNRYGAIDDSTDADGYYYIQLGEELYKGDLEKRTDVTDSAGRPATRWIYDGDEISTFGNAADKTYVVDDADKAVKYFLNDGDYLNYSDSRLSDIESATLNGDTNLTIASDVLQKGDVIEVYFHDDTVARTHNRGDVKNVVVLRYEAAVIDEIDTDVTSDQKRDGVTAQVTLNNVGDNDDEIGVYYDTIDASASSDEKAKQLKGFVGNTYVEGAAIAVALDSDSNVVDSYLIDVVTGEPTAARRAENSNVPGIYKNGNVTVGGTKYNYAGTVDGVSTSFDYDFDKEYNIYATREGYVLAVEGANGADIDDVYYVTGVYYVQNNYGTKTWYAQSVLLSDGTITDIKIDSDFAKAADSTGFDSLEDMLKKDSSTLWVADGTIAGDNTGVTETGVADAAEQTLYVTADKLYTFDKDGEPEAWNGDGDYTVGVSSLTDDFKTDDTRIEIGSRRYYVNGDTHYVNVEDIGEDISVKTATGGMSSKTSQEVILIRDGSDAVYVVYVGELTGAAEDVVYLAEKPNTSSGKDKWNATLYFMDDNSVDDVTLDDNYNAGFYTYSINSDGIYELDSASSEALADPADLSGSHFDGDSSGYVTDFLISDHNGNMMLGVQQTTNKFNVTGEEFGSAKVLDDDKDAHKGIYGNEINSVTRLKSAIDAIKPTAAQPVGGSILADIYVTEGDVTFVYVKVMNARSQAATGALTSIALTGAGGNNTITTGGSGANLTIAVALESGKTEAIITATKTAGQTVTVGGTAAASVADNSSSNSLSYTVSGLTDGTSKTFTLTVAETGKSSITYTVTVTVAAPHVHNLTWSSKINGTPATCQATGTPDHYTCTCANPGCNLTAGAWYAAAGTTTSAGTAMTDAEKVIAINPSAHNFASGWASDENTHWHACQNSGCTVKDSEADHHVVSDGDWGSASTGDNCGVCGYEKQ